MNNKSSLYISIKASVDIIRSQTNIHCCSSLDNIMDCVEEYERRLNPIGPSEFIETPENVKVN